MMASAAGTKRKLPGEDTGYEITDFEEELRKQPKFTEKIATRLKETGKMNLEAVMVMAVGYEEHTSDPSWDADEMEVLAGAAKGYLFKLSFNGLLERLRHGQISQSRFDEEQDDLITWAWEGRHVSQQLDSVWSRKRNSVFLSSRRKSKMGSVLCIGTSVLLSYAFGLHSTKFDVDGGLNSHEVAYPMDIANETESRLSFHHPHIHIEKHGNGSLLLQINGNLHDFQRADNSWADITFQAFHNATQHLSLSEPPRLKISSLQDLVICTSFSAVFTSISNGKMFAIDSDTSHLLEEYSISHWLQRCKIEAPVVHMYHSRHQSASSNKSDLPTSDSYCTVLYISGLSFPYSRDRSRIDGFNCSPTATGCNKPTCLEDFMNYLVISRHYKNAYRNQSYSECVLSPEVWNRQNFNNHSLHFFSSWGLMRLIDSVRHGSSTSTHQHGVFPPLSDARSLHSRMVRDDLMAVVKAFSNIGTAEGANRDGDCDTAMSSIGLVVHSLALPFSSPGKARPSKPLSRLLLALMLVYDTDAVPAAAYTAALQALSDRISTDLATVDAAEALEVVLHVAPLLDALMQLFGTDFRMFHNTCRRSSAGEVPMNYICRHHSARQQLSAVVANISERLNAFLMEGAEHSSDKNALNPLLRVLILLRRFSDEVLKVEDYLTYEPPVFPAAGRVHRSAFVSSAVPPAVNVVTDGDVYVFMFVRPEHIDLVQKMVYHWQRHAAEITTFLFVKYVIIPMVGPHDGEESSKKGDFYTRKPSLDAVLNVAAERIQQVCTVKDIVYVLVGLQAVLSMPQPGRRTPAEEAHLLALCQEGKIQRDPFTCDASVVDINTGSMYPKRSHLRPDIGGSTSCTLCGDGDAYGGGDRVFDFLQGVLPTVEYGGSARYRLDANIVFSATVSPSYPAASAEACGAHSNSRKCENDGEWIGVNAFLGVGYKVLDMINSVRTDPRYPILGSSNFSAVAVPVEQLLLREYVLNHPVDATVDCQQRAFHTTKSAKLIDRLLRSQDEDMGKADVDDVLQKSAHVTATAQDSISEILAVLTAVEEPHTSRRQSAATSLSCAQYRDDMVRLMDSFLHEDISEFEDVSEQLQYAKEIMPFVYAEKLPYLYNMRDSPSGEATNASSCYIDFRTVEATVAYMFTELYLPSKTLSTCLALIGALHQVISCSGDDTAQALEELLYFFTRVGMMSRYVTFIVPPQEFPLSVALLEVYEQRLLMLFNVNTSRYTTAAATAATTANSFAASSDTSNTGEGGSLNTELSASVFTEEISRRYATLPDMQKDQILIALRYALSGMKQEMAVYPDMVKQMEVALTPSTYQQVQQRRALWKAQAQQLSASLALSRDLDKEPFLSSSPTSLPQEKQQVHVPPAQAEDVPGKMAADAIASARSTSSSRGPRTHYVTYASEHKEGLQNLLDSATLAGIHIEVLGLGEPYRDYSSKTEAYLNFLLRGPKRTSSADSNHTSNNAAVTGIGTPAVSEDDVVLLMDAYDVLVFPSVQRAASVLAQAPTPLLFCAERGLYPEYSIAPFYQRGVQDPDSYSLNPRNGTDKNNSANPHRIFESVAADGTATTIHSSAFSQKFLNSGCILGRAGQVVDMLRYTRKYGRVFRDDQLMLARYMLENPGLASIDSGNKIFATNFKMTSAPSDIELTFDLQLRQVNANIGLLHCNNIGSGSSYGVILGGLKTFQNLYYSGPDGRLLLQALQYLSKRDHQQAMEVLNSPVVLNNCTSTGGTNPARSLLLKQLNP